MYSGDGSWGSLTYDSRLEGLISSIVSCNNIFKEWGGETRKWVEFFKEWEVAGKTQDMIPKRGGFYSSWIESQWSRREHERCRRNPFPSNNGEWPPFSWNVWEAVSSKKKSGYTFIKGMGGGDIIFLVVQWLNSTIPVQRVWVQSLVKELRFHMPRCAT